MRGFPEGVVTVEEARRDVDRSAFDGINSLRNAIND